MNIHISLNQVLPFIIGLLAGRYIWGRASR